MKHDVLHSPGLVKRMLDLGPQLVKQVLHWLAFV